MNVGSFSVRQKVNVEVSSEVEDRVGRVRDEAIFVLRLSNVVENEILIVCDRGPFVTYVDLHPGTTGGSGLDDGNMEGTIPFFDLDLARRISYLLHAFPLPLVLLLRHHRSYYHTLLVQTFDRVSPENPPIDKSSLSPDSNLPRPPFVPWAQLRHSVHRKVNHRNLPFDPASIRE